MTPKEKAKQLVWFMAYARTEDAKQCALTAVNEVLEAMPHWSDCAMNGEPAIPKGQCDCKQGVFWIEVKEEIIKL